MVFLPCHGLGLGDTLSRAVRKLGHTLRLSAAPLRRLCIHAILLAVSACFSEEPKMDEVGFCFLDRPETSKQIDLVKKIEGLGYNSAWVTETRLARDAFSVLGAFAAVTSRVQLCTGIVNSWTRGPALMAMTLATLDEMAPGRVDLRPGAYWDPLAWKQGIDRKKPVTQMREYLVAVRRLLNLETVTHEGEFVKLRDISLDLGHGVRRPRPVKLYIGPTGPVMTELAGEIADGAILNGLLSTEYTRGMVESIKIGAKRANRSLSKFKQPQLVNIALSDDAATYDGSRINSVSRYKIPWAAAAYRKGCRARARVAGTDKQDHGWLARASRRS